MVGDVESKGEGEDDQKQYRYINGRRREEINVKERMRRKG